MSTISHDDVRQLAATVEPTEAGIDAAFAGVATMLGRMAQLRAANGYPYAKAHRGLALGVKSLQSMVDARASVMGIHKELADAARAIDPIAFGDLHEDCENARTMGSAGLKLVG